MISDIECPVCGEVIGSVEKDLITDEDRALYQMVQRSQGHGQALLSEPVASEPNEEIIVDETSAEELKI